MTTLERDGTVDIAGRRFTWRTLGAGPGLLLVQGYGGTADDWPPEFLEALGQTFELIVPDNRGMGGSDLGDPTEVTIDSMAADLEVLLNQLAIDRIPILGFSMGGFIVQALALRRPESVESLALLSTDPGGPDAIRAKPTDWGRLVDHSGTPRERASRMISIVFPADVAPRFDREFGELAAASQATLDPTALAAQEEAMAQWWATSASTEPSPLARVLIGHGAQDVVIPPANAELLRARFPNARVELFTGAGHAFPAQRPEATAGLIASQLRS